MNELTFSHYNELIEDPSKSKAFQLLMYAYLYLKNNPGFLDLDVVVGNFAFKNLNHGLVKLSKRINLRQSENLRITEAVLDDFELQLRSLLSNIINNNFSQKPHLKDCRWCSYKILGKR